MIEFGSFFDARPVPPRSSAAGQLVHDYLVGTGRQAILQAARWLAPTNDVELLLPTYFCPDVANWLAERLPVRRYECGPFERPRVLRSAEPSIVLAVEYFGMPATVTVEGAPCIVDSTHAPWMTHAYPHAVAARVGSLRKALPIPDGGFIDLARPSSPAHTMAGPSDEVTAAAGALYRAMQDKSAWLLGQKAEKSYLDDHRVAEAELEKSDVSAQSVLSQSLLNHMSIDDVASVRTANLHRLEELLRGRIDGVTACRTPAYMVLLCESRELRGDLRSALIAAAVYPAILWDDIDGPPHHRDLSERMMVIHADFRYGPREIDELADRILRVRAAL